MIYICFEMATVFFECVFVHIFYNAWFGEKAQSSIYRIIYIASLFVCLSMSSLIIQQPALRSITGFLVVLTFAKLSYNVNTFSSIYSTVLFVALAVVSEYLCLILLGAFSIELSLLSVQGNARAIYLVLAKMVHFVSVVTASSILRKNRVALTPRQLAPLMPCLIVSIYICSVFFTLFPNSNENISLTLVAALIGIMYTNGVIVLHTQTMKSAAVEVERHKLANQQYELQARYYQNVIKDREDVRALWHDIKKYVLAIEAMVISGKANDVQSEFAQIKHSYEGLGLEIDVGDEVLNAILYHNIQRAKKHSIAVLLDIHIVSAISISAVDLSVILGNTFDNAIDECIAIGKNCSEITVSLLQQNNMLFYEIVNPCMDLPHRKAGRYHGYGLNNVKMCVDKYQGSMEKRRDSKNYCVSIRMNCMDSITVL